MSNVHVLIAGNDQVCYGGPERAPGGETWGSWARKSAGLDPERTHWLGVLQTDEYQALLIIVMPTLSHNSFCVELSLFRAMAVGAPGSKDIPCVRSFLTVKIPYWLLLTISLR